MVKLKHILKAAIPLSFVLIALAALATDPVLKMPKYMSECWRGGRDMGNYPFELFPDTGLYGITVR